jgi:hypothetical protein
MAPDRCEFRVRVDYTEGVRPERLTRTTANSGRCVNIDGSRMNKIERMFLLRTKLGDDLADAPRRDDVAAILN